MVGIIVVFPNKDNATNIRNLLVRGGMDVTGVATTGAQAMNYADTVDEGIVVCGYKLKDMMYTELREYLPKTFEMLLIASADKWSEGGIEGVVGLSMPIKVYDLMNTMDMMLRTVDRRRKKRKLEQKNRNSEQKALITKAKELLMARNNMTEAEAHRYLQKSSMDSGTNMVETAEMVLSIMSE
ncbi:ANTAR domain-containing response regulator [Bariatricus sp. SGI.154]|uniref:ANTAR domain-containing response regulator n=1 Tax=Bariatricus sp. SGI.154 TaxID=3420549 RepID=UPI003D005D8D